MKVRDDKMTPRVSGKPEVRTALLNVGMDMMFEKGYTNTGIQEILTALNVPKGSFYHYFDSKENYTVEIIRHFDQSYSADLVRILRNPKETPLQRLRTYCDNNLTTLGAQKCRRGCLIGTLSQEMSDQSEILRQELSTVMLKWRDMFTSCIEEGQQSGEICTSRPPAVLAELFLCGWSGAVMRAKTTQNTEPMETFIDVMFNVVLKG
ncbi:MAG: TetR/AcrR family transcriptional regulator [Candidatus Obscuribacterales bacterium]|nr:TetR/AcrR family transcriptional regulator [Candidatus Obscuribacterales bacterium]